LIAASPIPPQLKESSSNEQTSLVLEHRIHDEDDDQEDESSDDDDDYVSKCQSITQAERVHDADVTSEARHAAVVASLRGQWLATCHTNGDSILWDLGRQKATNRVAPNRGPAIALRRCIEGEDSATGLHTKILLQTRDEMGTVTLHDAQAPWLRDGLSETARVETCSQTFCQAAPCRGDWRLVALPAYEHDWVTVRDWRVPPSNTPVLSMPASAGRAATYDAGGVHDMLTSLAMSTTSEYGRPILACGMESGNVFFHDLAMLREKSSIATFAPDVLSSDVKLSQDPILSLDMMPSSSISSAGASVVTIAGMAGDSLELLNLLENERGTVAVLKTTLTDASSSLVTRLRSRVATCRVHEGSYSKPGVNLCRFRPDGRIFAVGGWDRRLRIFDRSRKTSPLAILKGHTTGVSAMDWAAHAATSGILATGDSDGCVYVWRCFSS